MAWPADFVEGGNQDAADGGADGGSGSWTQGAASVEASEGYPAMWRLQPAWVRVGSEGPAASDGTAAAGGGGCSTAVGERWEEEEEEDGSEEEQDEEGLTSCHDGAAVGGEQHQQRQHAAKRARREGTAEGPGLASKGRSRLPLLYPPLRFFLFDEGDIHAAYTPGRLS